MRTIKVMAMLVIVFSIAISLIFDGQVFITPIAEKLAPGIESEEVMRVQQRLKNWGYYDGNVSGKYDLKTYLAVMDFQKVYGLPVDGITSRETLEKMGLTTFAQSGAAMAAANRVSDEQLLARAINGEARGEVYEGQVAVGAVILNRTRDSKFPKTIAGVIYQPGAFTAVSDGQIDVPIDPNSTVVKAARDALNGWDPTNGCLYYWNPATATSKWIWSRKIVKKIGKHYFGI